MRTRPFLCTSDEADGEARMMKKYACMERPPAPGAVPREGLVHVSDEPVKDSWGYVIYDHPLSEADCDQYSLVPVYDELTDYYVKEIEKQICAASDSLIAWDYKCFLSRIKDLIDDEVERRM